MVRCAAVSLFALVLAAAHTADAKCAGPDLVFAPADGTSVSGVTWVFVPRYHEPKISIESRRDLDVAIAKFATDAYSAYRISVASSGVEEVPYTVAVDLDYGGQRRAGYYLTNSERPAPPAGRVLLDDPTYTRDEWTCSYTDAVTARPTVEAWAYRIEWARTEAEYRAGEREILVVPRSMKSFWRYAQPDQPTAIELGHLNCFGETIPRDALANTVYLGIIPLGNWATGPAPEHPIAVRSGEPPVIEALGEPEPEPEAEPIDTAYRCGLTLPENIEAYDREWAKRRQRRLPLGLPLAVVGALLGMLLGWRVTRRLDRGAAARLDALSLPQLALVAGVIAMAGWAPLAAAGGLIAGLAAAIAGAVTALRR